MKLDLQKSIGGCSRPLDRSTGGRGNRPWRSWSVRSWCRYQLAECRTGDRESPRGRADGTARPARPAAGGIGSVDPSGRLLPRQGPAAAEPSCSFLSSVRRLAFDCLPRRPDELREQLLGVHGIGPADGRFDPSCMRAKCPCSWSTPIRAALLETTWLARPGRRLPRGARYFPQRMPAEAAVYNEFRALLVRLGRDSCRKTQPKCSACPLKDLLPVAARWSRRSGQRLVGSGGTLCVGDRAGCFAPRTVNSDPFAWRPQKKITPVARHLAPPQALVAIVWNRKRFAA